jgi:hypothetical protein
MDNKRADSKSAFLFGVFRETITIYPKDVMKYSLRYALALSLIAAPLAATDCTESACAIEVAQPEQQVVQPFYKKVGQKLWEHRNKIAITLFTVGLVAASAYVLWKAGAPQQALTTPEALVPPVNAGNSAQSSAASTAAIENKASVENAPAPDINKQNISAPENKPLDSAVKAEQPTIEQPKEIASVVNAETEKSFFEKLKENGTSVVNWIIATDQAASKLTWSDVSAYSKAELSRIGQALKKGFGYTYGDAI